MGNLRNNTNTKNHKPHNNPDNPMKQQRKLFLTTKYLFIFFLTSVLGATVLIAENFVSIIYLRTGNYAMDWQATNYFSYRTEMANAGSITGNVNYSFYTASSVSEFNQTARVLNDMGNHVYGMEHTDEAIPGNVLSEGAPNGTGTESASSIDNNTNLEENFRCGDDGKPLDMRDAFNKIKKKESE